MLNQSDLDTLGLLVSLLPVQRRGNTFRTGQVFLLFFEEVSRVVKRWKLGDRTGVLGGESQLVSDTAGETVFLVTGRVILLVLPTTSLFIKEGLDLLNAWSP